MLTGILTAVVFQLGGGLSQQLGPEDEINYRESYFLSTKIGTDSMPLYIWGDASKGSNYILGQKISSVVNVGAGLGYRYDFDNNVFYLFAEAGVGYPIKTDNYNIMQEVTYTYLVRHHNVEGRPIPVDIQYPYDQDSYSTSWDIDYGAIMKVGFGWRATEHTRINVDYKYFNPRGKLELYDPVRREAGYGYWEEFVNVNMNTLEMSLLWEF